MAQPKDERLWMRFPITFDEDPLIEMLSDAAFRAFVAMNGYSRRNDLDGVIPLLVAVKRWGREVIDELAGAGRDDSPFFEVRDDVVVLTKYGRHQDTTEARAKRSATNAANGRKGGLKRAAKQVASESLSKSGSETQAETETETETEGNVAEIRPDVSRLCTILADLIEGNGSKRPLINKTWLNAARLLIDTDKRPLGEAIALMKWCQADSFWRANIMSMASFRAKYDTLRLQKDKPDGKKPSNITPQNEWMFR